MLFQLDHVDPGAPTVDASTNAKAPCDFYSDIRFDDPIVCAPWARAEMTNVVAMTQGPQGLLIIPGTQAGSNGGCYSLGGVPLTTAGVIAEVEDVLRGNAGEYTVLSLGEAIDFQIMVANDKIQVTNNLGTISFGDGPAMTYVAADMRWWRLSRSGTAVIAEYSATSTTWTRLGGRFATQVTAEPYVTAGYAANRSAPTEKAVYRRLLFCK
jgi:hypothetical protein